MKSNIKITKRDAWILAIAPSLIICAIYYYGIIPGQDKELAGLTSRWKIASVPPAAPGDPPSLIKARNADDSIKRELSTRRKNIDELQDAVDQLPKDGVPAANNNNAQVIRRVEEIFARNGITPVISQSAGQGDSGRNDPNRLVQILAPRTDSGFKGSRNTPRVWHFIFDDQTPRFAKALTQVVQDKELSGVVPLSMNLVYNPKNWGSTRLLELWLLY